MTQIKRLYTCPSHVQRALKTLARIDLMFFADYYDASMCLLALRLSQGEGRWGAVQAAVRERAAVLVDQICYCRDKAPRQTLLPVVNSAHSKQLIMQFPHAYTPTFNAHMVSEIRCTRHSSQRIERSPPVKLVALYIVVNFVP
jgi:hypothetical protein